MGARTFWRAPIKMKTVTAILVVLAVVAIACAGRLALRAAGGRPGPRPREGYLVYPYLDLDEPGERGSYYALAEGC